jgi:hypothetical protein
MTSKYKLKSFFPLLVIAPLIFGLVNYISFALDKTKPTPPLGGLPLILLFTFTILWLFFGEFRTKMIKVVLNDDHLLIKTFGGLSTAKKYLYKDLDGFKTSILRSRGGDNEYLYFIKDNKKVGKISDFYHKNYLDLKTEISSKLDDLGFEKFSYKDELKETFS